MPPPAHAYSSLSLAEIKQKENEIFVFAAMPDSISDGETMPIAMLAKTYIKEGLTDVERLHAKCAISASNTSRALSLSSKFLNNIDVNFV